ncbi:hypothetical protein ACFGVS_10775 [Mucilaginibacter sp. AW1-7]|uniref:baeRF3 domain-containing protein n=1 Tax=Mucilaginibacter sp. AW1-7 TaxID=3349874 RepID=UPI003F73AF0E
MDTTLSPEIHEVIDAVHYRPALSLILPLEPHISLKTETAHIVKIAADNAEREMRRYYPEEQCQLIMRKLQSLTADLDIPAKKKGMAIYISPVFEKVLYLDCPVTQQIIVDESFEIRDLLYNAKQDIKFLLLLLTAQESRFFLGDAVGLTPLPARMAGSIETEERDMPERISNFSDMTEHKQVTARKFLAHIDHELGDLVGEHQLPVLVLGTEGIIGEFRKQSKYTASVIGYLSGNYDSTSLAALTELIEPHLDAWKITRQQQWIEQVGEAADQFRLAVGIREVWQAASEGKGKLLIVEKSYGFPAQHGVEPGTIEALTEPYNHFSYIRDAVDDVLEKVLGSGGDVVFTEDGALGRFGQVALIKYYE